MIRRAAVLTAVLLCSTAGASDQHQGTEDLAVAAAKTHVEAEGPRILEAFVELLRIPNVTFDTANIRRNAEFLRDALASRGVDSELLESDDDTVAPLVFGKLEVPGATRTLGLYLHYDGQPVAPERWAQPPFSPTLLTGALDRGGEPRSLPKDGEAIDPEWRLYGRSSGDDKGPAIAMLAALDALAAAKVPLTSNLVFLFEGEEEAGSPHLEQFFRRHRDQLQVDGWLIFDGPSHQSGRPQLVFGVRGIVSAELTVYGALRDLHSGHYGNWAPNPAMRLAKLLSTFKTANDEIAIPGFADGMTPLNEGDRTMMSTVPPVDDELLLSFGLASSEGEGDLLTRLLLPSLNVRGLASGGTGDKARNAIPATAVAALDIRLVAGLQPEVMLDRLEAHITAQGYHVVREDPDLETRHRHSKLIKIERQGGYRAVRTPADHPFAQGVIKTARRAAGDQLVLQPSLGGSLPLYLFEEILDAPLVVVPIANHDNNQHAPNENLRLGNLWYGIELLAAVFTMESAPETAR